MIINLLINNFVIYFRQGGNVVQLYILVWGYRFGVAKKVHFMFKLI